VPARDLGRDLGGRVKRFEQLKSWYVNTEYWVKVTDIGLAFLMIDLTVPDHSLQNVVPVLHKPPLRVPQSSQGRDELHILDVADEGDEVPAHDYGQSNQRTVMPTRGYSLLTCEEDLGHHLD